jgi:poly(A) polymerase Pap1
MAGLQTENTTANSDTDPQPGDTPMSTTSEDNYTYIVAESIREMQKKSKRDFRPGTPEYTDLMQNIDYALQQTLQSGEVKNGCKKHLKIEVIEEKQERSNREIKPRNPQFNDLLQNIEYEIQAALAKKLKENAE